MTARDDLPLPDYDHLQVGSLTSRIRSLGREDLETLLGYERSHANRFQVVTVMQSRLAGLKKAAPPADDEAQTDEAGTATG